MISVPWAAAMVFVPLTVGSSWLPYALFLVVSITSMIFWVMMTNQIHKWSHVDEPQLMGWVKWAQRLHLIMPPSHHERHHTPPYDTYYCITTGWLNWPLATIGFYRFMERVLMATTSMIPRRDDIGLVAALKIAPVAVDAPKQVNQRA
jgi:ubiquitin-conjugating enzyme E2 variant